MAILRSRHARVRFTPPPPDAEPSEEQINIFLNTFAEDFSEYEARRAAHISRKRLKELKQDPAFMEVMAEIVADNKDRLKDAAVRKALAGDKDLLKLLLPAYFPDEFGPRAAVLNLNVPDVTKLSTEELDELIAKHGRRQ